MSNIGDPSPWSEIFSGAWQDVVWGLEDFWSLLKELSKKAKFGEFLDGLWNNLPEFLKGEEISGSQEFSIQDLIDNLYQIRKRMQEQHIVPTIVPTQYVAQIRPDIYKMIEVLAEEGGISWEEAWFGLLNGEFE